MAFETVDDSVVSMTSALLTSVKLNDIDGVRDALMMNSNKDTLLCSKAMILAAQLGFDKVVKALLEAEAALETRSSRGDTALHWAAQKSNLELVTILIEKGADINAAGDLGNRPIHLAVSCGSVEIVDFLLQRGAIVDVRNDFGKLLVSAYCWTTIFLVTNSCMFSSSKCSVLTSASKNCTITLHYRISNKNKMHRQYSFEPRFE